MVDAVVDFPARFQFLQLYAVRRQPLTVRMLVGQTVLDFAVVVDFTFLGVDKQNLSWLQTSLLGYLRRIEVHDSHLRCHDHSVVLRNRVSCRAQTVTVEHSTGITAVGEEQGGRTVPWLHEDGMILVESLEILGDRVLVVEALRNHDCHGLRQRQSAHDEEFENVVEACRVRHVGLDNRRNLTDVAENLRREHRLAGLHPSAVTTDGVYLTVVGQHAERLCQTPCRERVCRETAVDDGQTRREVVVRQVGVVLAQLQAGEHSLVDDALARQ